MRVETHAVIRTWRLRDWKALEARLTSEWQTTADLIGTSGLSPSNARRALAFAAEQGLVDYEYHRYRGHPERVQRQPVYRTKNPPALGNAESTAEPVEKWRPKPPSE